MEKNSHSGVEILPSFSPLFQARFSPNKMPLKSTK